MKSRTNPFKKLIIMLCLYKNSFVANGILFRSYIYSNYLTTMVNLTLYIPSSHEQATNPGMWIPSYPVALTCVYTLGALSNVAEEQLALFVSLKILKCDILQNPESIRILTS